MLSPHVPTLLTWPLSALVIAPSALLWAAAAFTGPRTSAILLIAGGIYMVAALAGLQPWLMRARGRRRLALARDAAWFRERAMSCASIADLAVLLAETSSRLLGSERALLVLTNKAKELTVHGGTEGDAGVVRQHGAAIEELADRSGVCTDPTGHARALFDALGCHIALPLRHGDEPLGVALLGGQPQRIERAGAQVAWLRSALSMALVRLRLGFDLQHRVALKSSLDYARAAQEAIMPAETPFRSDGFVIHGMFRPATHCGGDLWLWRRLSPGRILVVLGDVTGHGVAPAMLSAAAAGVVQIQAIAAAGKVDPADVLSAIDHSIHRAARGSYLMTAFAAVIDREQGTLRYANAAQSFPYLQRMAAVPGAPAMPGSSGPPSPSNPHTQALVVPGPMLGVDGAARFAIHTQPIGPGTRLLLYTDGIVDAARRRGQNYGDRRLRRKLMDLAAQPGETVAPAVLEDVQSFLGNAQADDDMTVVVVDWPLAAGAE
jgi:serine phosphatase RsbU (regulator of sigma subunit)